jgi:hypothetical protein
VPLTLFLKLCLFQAKPQDLPFSAPLLAGALALNFAVDVASLLRRYDLGQSLLGALLSTGLLMVFTYAVMRVRSTQSRTVQTLTALAGSGATFSAVALVALLPFSVSAPTPAATLVWLLFLAWAIAVYGHVLRHALDVPWFIAAAVAFLYLDVSIGLLNVVLESPALPEVEVP